MGTHAHVHFDKLTAADRKERNFTLTSACLGNHGLPCTWRSSQQSPFGYPCAQFVIFLRKFEEIDEFNDLILGFLHADHILESHLDDFSETVAFLVLEKPRNTLSSLALGPLTHLHD